MAAVEAGVGVGFVSYLALEKAVAVASVRVVSIENGPLLRPLSIVLREGPEPQGPVHYLAQLLRQYLIPRPHDITAYRVNGSGKALQSGISLLSG